MSIELRPITESNLPPSVYQLAFTWAEFPLFPRPCSYFDGLTRKLNTHTPTHSHIYTHAYTHIHIYTYSHTHQYTHIYACTHKPHTHTYLYTPTHTHHIYTMWSGNITTAQCQTPAAPANWDTETRGSLEPQSLGKAWAA